MKAVIFDFDGTIIDTESVWFEVYRDLLKKRYGYSLSLKMFAQVIGTVNDVLANQLEEEIGDAFDRKWLEEQAEEEFQNRRSALVLRDDVRELIGFLIEQNVKLAIASSSRLEWVQAYLEKEKLTDYFPILLTSDDVAKVKPDPELYVRTLEKLGLHPEEAVAIEDSGHGSQAAVDAGIQTFVVPNPVTSFIQFPKEVTKFDSFQDLRKALEGRQDNKTSV
ncbi:HAD family hydrolase [Bacillus litorisediminis]|uniref:HAD family hydrolase n=1 Tax=Bacillus litorisediminis TaxID=2922713 RepID=UPI001FABB791|nr:HAD-IA family hydrolase [Bacillus litorisediminis]